MQALFNPFVQVGRDRSGFGLGLAIGYSPIRDESDRIGGTFVTCTETTQRVLGERRLRTLRDLAVRAPEETCDKAAVELAARVLSSNPTDIPFCALYLLEPDGQSAVLEGISGLEPSSPVAPARVKLAAAPWPLLEGLGTRQAVVATEVQRHFPGLRAGPWPSPRPWWCPFHSLDGESSRASCWRASAHG